MFLMIDLHTHTLLSDGVLIPAELIRRAKVAGYQAIALTDHADESNLDQVVTQLRRAAGAVNVADGIQVLAGVELTHVPPRRIAGLVRRARELGAQIIVVHGETPVEPVAPGTNRAAIAAGVDVLAHPGLLTMAEAKAARQQGVALELTSRGGHCLTNGHVAKLGLAAGCTLVVNSDTHAPKDLHTLELITKVVRGAGLPAAFAARAQANAWKLWRRLQARRNS
jgi:putative hydrolase